MKANYLQKGKFVFIEDLEQREAPDKNVPYFVAKAIAIIEIDGGYHGDISTFNISNLILKQSSYIYDGVNSREAHKLYTWPRNLGDMSAWAESKRTFLSQHVMHFPIEVISTGEQGNITWKFITPEEFKKIPDHIHASKNFQEYMNNINDYHFLRKDQNPPV